jgi:N-dimethylarginine dimethylaminohydrolase
MKRRPARLAAAARADGGDFIWLDERTMLAGRSYRTNPEGLRQQPQILAAEGASLEPAGLPHDRGPGHVLHLMSLISPVADDLAAACPPLAPAALMQTLAKREGRVVPVAAASTRRWGATSWRPWRSLRIVDGYLSPGGYLQARHTAPGGRRASGYVRRQHHAQ